MVSDQAQLTPKGISGLTEFRARIVELNRVPQDFTYIVDFPRLRSGIIFGMTQLNSLIPGGIPPAHVLTEAGLQLFENRRARQKD